MLPKRIVTLYFAAAVAVLFILHVIKHQTTAVCTPSVAHAVDIDSPGVFDSAELTRFLRTLRRSKLEDIHKSNMGAWAVRKGLNLVATLDNGEKVFLKQRRQFRMQGELFSYHLNCYLDMWNVPPTALGCISKSNGSWINNLTKPINSTAVGSAHTCYIITPYVKDTNDLVYMPDQIRWGINLETISTTPRELNHFMEWSDMIVFDFLTGHSDRLTNMLFLPHINFQIPLKRVPNLSKTLSGELILIDHDGTFHNGYLKARISSSERQRQAHYLRTVSVFRRHTVQRLCALCSHEDPAAMLETYMSKRDPISILTASKLRPEDREDFKKRVSRVCLTTCHLL